jgi:purine/pyrimidine-nucleoside phosphorylase
MLVGMHIQIPERIAAVNAATRANIYFDGRVVSHTLELADGARVTLGLIYAGTYHFGTAAAERMEIVDGQCSVVIDGQSLAAEYGAGTAFEVGAQSGFTITVSSGICQYICRFLQHPAKP